MKKVRLCLMAAFFVASAMFVGCDKDPDPYVAKDGPTISVTFDDVAVTNSSNQSVLIGETKTLVINYVAEGGIKEITLTVDGVARTFPFTLGATEATYEALIAFDFPLGKDFVVETTITDNQGTASAGLPDAIPDKEVSRSFTIKVEENALEEENFAFTWERIGGTNATGLAKYGLDWFQSTGTPLTAHIRTITGSGNEWYKFENTVYSAVTTKEGLKALFTDDKKQSGSFTEVNFATRTYNIVIGTKVIKATGDEYYLINITASNEETLNAGTPTETVRRIITGRSKF